MKIHNESGHSFIYELAQDAKVAFDCGANRGAFSRWLHDNTNAMIYGFEPDPRLFPDLPVMDRVEFVAKAVDGVEGELELALGETRCSSAIYRESDTQQIEIVPKISLEKFCEERGIHNIDFLKLDVEGAELSILENASDDFLQKITQITVEFHDFLNKSDIPRIEQISARLVKSGFWCCRFTVHTWGDCLFINERHFSLGRIEKMRLILFGKYFQGVGRIVSRLLPGI
ncbi:MAG: FkbM family methyltransferase [Nodosilinea sp.]